MRVLGSAEAQRGQRLRKRGQRRAGPLGRAPRGSQGWGQRGPCQGAQRKRGSRMRPESGGDAAEPPL